MDGNLKRGGKGRGGKGQEWMGIDRLGVVLGTGTWPGMRPATTGMCGNAFWLIIAPLGRHRDEHKGDWGSCRGIVPCGGYTAVVFLQH